MRLHVTAIPRGPAPEQHRKQWLGMLLPLVPGYDGPVQYPAEAPGLEPARGYLVPGATAIELLSLRSGEAANWFVTSFLRDRPQDTPLLFDLSCGSLVGLERPVESERSFLSPATYEALADLASLDPPTADPFSIALTTLARAESAHVRPECGQVVRILDDLRRTTRSAEFPCLNTVLAASVQLSRVTGFSQAQPQHMLLAALRIMPASARSVLAEAGLAEAPLLNEISLHPSRRASHTLPAGSCRSCDHESSGARSLLCTECAAPLV